MGIWEAFQFFAIINSATKNIAVHHNSVIYKQAWTCSSYSLILPQAFFLRAHIFEQCLTNAVSITIIFERQCSNKNGPIYGQPGVDAGDPDINIVLLARRGQIQLSPIGLSPISSQMLPWEPRGHWTFSYMSLGKAMLLWAHVIRWFS